MYNKLNILYESISECDFIKFNTEDEETVTFNISLNVNNYKLAITELFGIYSCCTEAILISRSGAPRFNSNKTSNFIIDMNANVSELIKISKTIFDYKLYIDKNKLISYFQIKKDNINFSIIWSENTLLNSLNSIFENDIIDFPYIKTDAYNVILLFSSNIYIYNEFLIITNIEKININNYSFHNEISTIPNKRISFRRNNCLTEFSIPNLFVDLFIFDYKNNNFLVKDEFISVLDSLILKLVLINLCNTSYLSSDYIELKFKGEKIVDISLSRNEIIKCNNTDLFIELYSIAYSSLKIDMLYMVRNTITLYICDDCKIDSFTLLSQNIEEILEACKYNLNISSINNINNYFTNRYTLFDFLDKNILRINEQIDSLISKMNKTFLSTIASLVGVSFVYLKDKNITILNISLIIYSLYLIIDCMSTFYYTRFSYKNILTEFEDKKKTFEPILKSFDIFDNDTKNTVLISTKKTFNIYYYVYLVIYISIILLSIFSCFELKLVINFITNLINPL